MFGENFGLFLCGSFDRYFFYRVGDAFIVLVELFSYLVYTVQSRIMQARKM